MQTAIGADRLHLHLRLIRDDDNDERRRLSSAQSIVMLLKAIESACDGFSSWTTPKSPLVLSHVEDEGQAPMVCHQLYPPAPKTGEQVSVRDVRWR
jgi:hypothetical protein